MNLKRYDIHWVELDPTRGSELRKTRPAVIVSMDMLNRALETVVVCPLTSQLHPDWRTRLPVKVKGKSCEDRRRFLNPHREQKPLGKRNWAPLPPATRRPCAGCSAKCSGDG